MEHGLLDGILSRALSGLDHGLFTGELGKELENYIIACHAEGKADGTLDHYSRRIHNFFDFVSSTSKVASVQSVTPHDVRLYILYLKGKGLSPATTNAHYRALRTFFNWLVAEETLKHSPMDHMKPPKVPDKTRIPFSAEDIRRLLLLCRGNKFLDIRNRSLVMMFMDTGLRLREMTNVQLYDIDIEHRMIKIMGKGAKERYVKFGLKTEKSLLEYLAERKKKFNDKLSALWITEEGRVITWKGIQVAIKRLCHRAGITDTKPGPHSFRHFFASNLLLNGGNEDHLQSLLGHATKVMTRHYAQSVNNIVAMVDYDKVSPVDRL